MVLVREPIAAVRRAVRRQAVDDRRLQLLLAVGAGQGGEAGDGNDRQPERLFEPVGVSLRRQCTMDPLSVPVLTPVAWFKVLCSVKVPVASAKRPVPPVIV